MDAKQSLGEPRLLISRSALLHNAGLIRRSVPQGTRICAMLKADAYGHDATIVADALCNFSADQSDTPAVDSIAVASIDEAAALPDVRVPVMVFRPIENAFLGRQRSKFEHAIRQNWVLTLCSTAAAEDLARIAVGCQKQVSVQVMVDTGMSRCGIGINQLHELLHKIHSRPSLRLVGVSSHFSNAEQEHSTQALDQLARFRQATDPYAEAFRGKVLRSIANSAATFFLPASHLEMVRPGLSLYGIDATGNPDVRRPLRPVMKWLAPLIHIRPIRRGVGVGYNHQWRAPRDTRIGLVPCGYADGYPRAFGNKGVVLIHGKPAPVVGNISMDMLTVDLGEVPQAQLGDDVTLLDNDPISPVSVYGLARWNETIPYEVFCRIGKRVQRVAVAPEGWGHLETRQPLAAG